MSSSKPRLIAGWVLSSILAAMFLVAGLGKLTGSATEMFAGWGYAAWFATLIGGLELAGGAGLVIPKLTRLAILGLTGIMIGAAYTHIANGEGAQVLRPVLFAVMMFVAGWLRGSGRSGVAR
jgi:uncharacterized membrane protein YphA (DoxX/SURF4 family)